MTKNFFKVLLILILSIGLASTSLAQRQTGSIAGKVIDDEGNPLPGASVTLSGPHLMGTISYSTTESGDFRFPVVPPGKDYILVIELSGFQTLKREGINVSVGKTARLVIELKPATIEEEVTIVATPPAVDVTSSKHSVIYSSELIENIPLERDYFSIILSGPGIVPDYSEPQRVFISHGMTARDNQVALEGVNITDTAAGSNKIGFSYDIYEEVEFELGAHPAEVGFTPGAYLNIVTKSGGNEFHGALRSYLTFEDLSRSLIPSPEAETVGLAAPTGLKSLYDFSLSLGGPIVKDKLWFFVNGVYLTQKTSMETIIDGLFDMPRKQIDAFAKLSFQLHPNLKLVGMVSFRNFDQEYYPRPARWFTYFYSKYCSYYFENFRNWVALAMANWILDKDTFLDIRFMYNYKIDPFHINPNLDPNSPHYQDLYTGIHTGAPQLGFFYDFIASRTQIVANFNRFLDNFLGGNHEIKAGVEYDVAPCHVPYWQNTAIPNRFTYNGLPWAYHDAVPYMGYFETRNIGAKPGDFDARWKVRRFGLYIQDSYTIKDRLTLNLGLRYDESHGDVLGGTYNSIGQTDPVLYMLAPDVFSEISFPDDPNVLVWKEFSPRIGLVFDVFGDGTTSFSASWARYNRYQIVEHITGMGPAHPAKFTAYWFDLNKDGIIDTTDNFTILVKPHDPSLFDVDEYRDKNTKSPYTNEVIISLKRELFKDFSLGVSYINKKVKRMIDDVERLRGYTSDSEWWIPVTITEPGWDGQYGTSDDKQITVYGLKEGAPKSDLYYQNVPEGKRDYHALEFVFEKKMSRGWQFFGSITLSSLKGNKPGDYSGTSSNSAAFNNPNWLVNGYGRDFFDRPLLIKLQGSVFLPLDFMLSSYYFHSSGEPWGRTLMIQLPNDPTTFEYPGTFTETVLAETSGTRRNHSRSNLDIRLEKSFNVKEFGRIGIFLDVINVLGEKGYEISQDPGGRVYNDGTFQRWPVYGQFTNIYGLTIFKLSARFTF